ncbi:MAG: FG-GAP repeat domain-containing protein [Xanthobacteraceae bacterium]
MAVTVYDIILASGVSNDTGGGTEPSIAINPLNPNEIEISAFSAGRWNNNATIWHSTNGGLFWTQENTIPPPPGATGTSGCPCDQTFDYGRSNTLFGALLTDTPLNIYSGSTTDPTNSASWMWWTVNGTAQRTNAAASLNNADQPWLLHNRGATTTWSNDNVYVAYGDFVATPVAVHVATSINSAPPVFNTDVVVGTRANGAYNPGARLAKDPRNGWMYALWQSCSANCTSNQKQMQYWLNLSRDNGSTWCLNGCGPPTGLIIATANTTQPLPKFCTVNAQLGGRDHAAVDPQTGDLYYVYGTDDTFGNRNLAIRRISPTTPGIVSVGPEVNVTGTLGTEFALPSVAVTDDGVVGVLFYQCLGTQNGFPWIEALLAVSTDQGKTFSYPPALLTFLSPAKDDGTTDQRVLGDYIQMKAVGNCFYGTFVGNRAAFQGSTAINDPMFFKACVPTSQPNRNFNGTVDNRADILWRRNNGDLAMWDMNGASFTGAAMPNVSRDWHIIGADDFNGDGNADILWRQDNGDVAIWFMNGSTATSTAGVANVSNVWQVAATGDFNGDGKADLLWRNTSTGDAAIWLMNGASLIGSASLGAVSLDWVAEKAGYINADNKSDIQWRNRATGDVAVWFMTGTATTVSVSSTASLGAVPVSWRLVRLADFNNDGKQDFLWRNADGTVAIWLMNGASVIGTASLGVVPTDWRIVGAGDFNGDGFNDILWRNIAECCNNYPNPPSWPLAMWFMTGTATTTSVGSTANVGSVDASWSVD